MRAGQQSKKPTDISLHHRTWGYKYTFQGRHEEWKTNCSPSARTKCKQNKNRRTRDYMQLELYNDAIQGLAKLTLQYLLFILHMTIRTSVRGEKGDITLPFQILLFLCNCPFFLLLATQFLALQLTACRFSRVGQACIVLSVRYESQG